MNVPLWQITVLACFAKLAACGVVKSFTSESIDVTQTLQDRGSPDLCPATNSRISTYLPHPDDCGLFYICENKIPHLKKCPNGLHFNVKLKACDYPETAGCDKNAVVTGKGRIAKETVDTCPEKNSKFPVYLPDPDDCTRFFVCDNGVPHVQKCLPGLHFNPRIDACDYPENSNCDADADDKRKGRINDDDAGECSKGNSVAPVFLPHPDDCNRFYICSNGSPVLKSCLPELHFNPKLNACDFPENAGCDEDSPKSRIRDNSSGMCRAESSAVPEYFPHPDDCNKFYICHNGLEALQKCPAGLHFNPEFGVCDYPENADCDTDDSTMLRGMAADGIRFFSCPDADTSTRHPHPTDCDKFYECDRGKPSLKICDPGLNFNREMQSCDRSAVCEEETTIAFAGVRSPYCPSVDGKMPIFFRHPTNCTVYYMCGNGFAYEFVCPARLHFNLRRRFCDYEENSRCKI